MTFLAFSKLRRSIEMHVELMLMLIYIVFHLCELFLNAIARRRIHSMSRCKYFDTSMCILKQKYYYFIIFSVYRNHTIEKKYIKVYLIYLFIFYCK